MKKIYNIPYTYISSFLTDRLMDVLIGGSPIQLEVVEEDKYSPSIGI